METNIIISGDPFGVNMLFGKIPMTGAYSFKLSNGWRIQYATKKEAKQALWNGYKTLRSVLRDEYGKIPESMLNYSKHGYLEYDSSKAKIIDNKS